MENEEWKPDKEIFCEKCGTFEFTANQYYDDDDEFIVELICMKCKTVQYFQMVVHCHECDDNEWESDEPVSPDDYEGNEFQHGYDQAIEDMQKEMNQDAHEEKYGR